MGFTNWAAKCLQKTRQLLNFLHNYGMTWTFQNPKSNRQNGSTHNPFVWPWGQGVKIVSVKKELTVLAS